jgi:membrane-bound lytic murein transglycosylase B
MFVSIFAHMRCVVAATVIGVGLSQTALAQQTPQPQPHRQQFAEDNWLTRILQPSAQPSVPARAQGQAQSQAQPQAQTQSGAAREWSGQSGGSRHPLMTADAIRAAAADFANCIAGMEPLAERRGVSREAYAQLTAGLTPDLSILDLLDAQPEFNKSPWDYLDILVSDERIARGRELLAQYAQVFAAVERAYGVDRHILAAIWGVESNYGTKGGDRSVLRSTATLACVGRRRDFFRDEFLAALELLARGDVKPDRLIGSWAGAFGPTQFMPSTFKRFAVDFDHDGHRDVVDSVADVMASTANNLKTDGWVPGESWGYEVALPAGFDYLLADRSKQMTIAQWQGLGVKRVGDKPFPRPSEKAFLLLPAGARGPAFLMLQNFRVIMKYNPAEAYALAIGHLADRLRGGGTFVQPWPRDERALSMSERFEMQQLLARRGYDIGEPDGLLGPRTRIAIRNFQAATGQLPDGFASSGLLDRLRQP